jgi:hypothetical protein
MSEEQGTLFYVPWTRDSKSKETISAAAVAAAAGT